MRKIISEDKYEQHHVDDNGREFIYRKDFISGGDMNTEFSLALIYSRPYRVITTPPIAKSEGHENIESRALGSGASDDL